MVIIGFCKNSGPERTVRQCKADILKTRLAERGERHLSVDFSRTEPHFVHTVSRNLSMLDFD
jgi:hypothetical protein